MRFSITIIVTTLFVLAIPLFARDTMKINQATTIDSTFIDSATAEPADLTKVKVDTLLTTTNPAVLATERKGFHIIWIMIAILLALCFIGFRYKYRG